MRMYEVLQIGKDHYIGIDSAEIHSKQGLKRLDERYEVSIIRPEAHTIKCLWRRTKSALDLNFYASLWPHYCQTCNGWGTVSFGCKSGKCEMLCTDCIVQGVCPRCHMDAAKTDEQWSTWLGGNMCCPHCGWDWGNNDNDFAPLVASCSCTRTDHHPVDTEDWLHLLRTVYDVHFYNYVTGDYYAGDDPDHKTRKDLGNVRSVWRNPVTVGDD